MNVEVLRARYSKLTPFERASLLVLEATGARRISEADALVAPTRYDSFWMSEWNSIFFTIAAYGMFQALWNDRLFFADHEKDAEKFLTACAWIMALKRLEDETGAPFIAAGKILHPGYADFLLSVAQKLSLTDCEEEYALLLVLWKTSVENINREDAHRGKVCGANQE